MYNRFYINRRPRKTPVYNATQRDYDFMKNWRVVRYYIQKRYELSMAELEMLLYLYDENVFDKDLFNEFSRSMSWDKERFQEMCDRGFFKLWRKGKRAKHKQLYELSHQAKIICSHTYKKLLGLELISENPYRNSIMKGESYTDKIYRNLIKKMNQKTTIDSRIDEELL